MSWFSDLPISSMVHPELTKLCGELRFGPKPTPHVFCGLARRDGGSRLHKPVFVQIFTKSPFWNPRWLGKYAHMISSPDSSESSLSHLYDTFDWITIDWTTKVLSLGKSPSLSWQAGPFGNLRSLPQPPPAGSGGIWTTVPVSVHSQLDFHHSELYFALLFLNIFARIS